MPLYYQYHLHKSPIFSADAKPKQQAHTARVLEFQTKWAANKQVPMSYKSIVSTLASSPIHCLNAAKQHNHGNINIYQIINVAVPATLIYSANS